ncbi:MAG: hypothetical protein ABH832_03640 [bacterium]
MLPLKAEKIINNYFNLPFKNVDGVCAPYFIAKKTNQRAQLRALCGKGTPLEIVEEAKIISIQYGDNLFNCHGACCAQTKDSADLIRKYLIDHNIGVDCSGFAGHVLREHFIEQAGLDIFKKMCIAKHKNIFRRIIARLRPAENIGVKTFADDKNSVPIKKIKNIKPADIIIMLETGPNKKRDHILIITGFDGKIIEYVHSRAWSSDGKYGHGVSRGIIKIIDANQNLVNQKWIEKEKVNQENETFLLAREANILEIRRLNI